MKNQRKPYKGITVQFFLKQDDHQHDFLDQAINYNCLNHIKITHSTYTYL